ncbi:uracil-DNA glycosylase [Ahrensia sp. 13_GOM-1096m]|uniref:uracil-DNA glycosylase n=1 Tax=Ahrensia sp. 13_GOM-1096m TaxID=1380380 RepID=UPI00047DFA4E|nr:uracil-DNA glycosylase [Ahrensia sp. 13_GOM-1096m]
MSDTENTSEMTVEEIHSLLRFYAESGLDFPISDVALDRFEMAPEQAAPQSVAPVENIKAENKKSTDPHEPELMEMDPRKRMKDAPRPIAQANLAVTLPTEEVVAKAVAMADAAQDLDALKQAVETFEGCNLKRSARSTIFEGGKRGARLMIIGGAPTGNDDNAGSAFSGPNGLLLEKMLGAIGLSRHEDVYMSYCVPWNPPGNSAPTPLHLEMCAPFLARQIQLAKPELILVLGNGAVRHILKTRQTIMQARGKWTELPNFGIQAIATFDPAMLINQPKLKRHAWLDLLSVKAKLAAQ